MTRTEERLADALGAAAGAVGEDTLHPLAIPAPGHRPPGRPGWLAPVAAAVGVALAIALAVLAGRISARHPGPTQGLPAGLPRYYVMVGRGPGRPVVRSTATGKMISMVPVPVTGNPPGYDVSTADGAGTFFVAAFSRGRQGEHLYRFRLTPAGRVTGFSVVAVGELAGRNWAADALTVSPNGSRIAVGMKYAARQPRCGRDRQQVCPQRRPDYVLAINLATGARTTWRWADSPVVHSFSVDSLSWTSDDRKLVLLGQWCDVGRTNQTCARGSRLAQVEVLDPAAGDGGVGARPLLPQSASFPDIVQAQISPDGTSVTAVVLRGHAVGYGHVPPYLSVERISVVEGTIGRLLAVLYQRRLSNTADTGTAPDFIALSQDATGQHLLLSGGFCGYGCRGGFNGWIHDGRLVPVQPPDDRESDQAW
jgi:hypothetical protein